MPSSPVSSGAASPTPARGCTARSNDYGRSVVSRDDLNASELAELAALDRILAREPVDEEHLELAALVDSVRAGAPRMDREFAVRLDAQIAQRLARGRRVPPARQNIRRVAFASGGVVAAAVALTIVISAGLLNGGSTNVRPPSGSQFATPKSATPNDLARGRTLAPPGTTNAFGAGGVTG